MFFTRKRLKTYLIALLVMQVFTAVTGSSLVWTNYIDFRTFYTAGYMVRTGNAASLYDYAAEQQFQNRLVSVEDRALPMMCPPYTALLFVPFSFLSFRAAYLAFLLLNLCLFLLSAAIVASCLKTLRDRWTLAPYALWLAFLPAGIALLFGQVSVLILLLDCLSFEALRRGRPAVAGLFLSLALIKFQIALPVALLFLCWRQWRFVAGFLTGASALTALSAAVLGPGNLLPYLASLVAMAASITPDPSMQSHFAIVPAQMPNLYGLLFTVTHGARIAIPLAIAASIAFFVWAATTTPSLPRALLVGTLVSYHLFLYDLTVLLLPLGMVLNRLILEDAQPDDRKQLPSPREPWKFDPRFVRWLAPAATAVLLIAPFERLLIAANASYLLSVPILILALFDRHLGEQAIPLKN